MQKTRQEKRKIRHKKVRAKIIGDSARPRFSVFKSNTAIYVQLVDDKKSKTILSFDSRKVEGKTLTEKAKSVGQEIAKMAKEKKIKEVVFDRGGYLYAGVIKILADSARDNGLKF